MKYKPTITLFAEDLPEIKNWNVGKKYKFLVEAEMVSVSNDDSYSMEAPGGEKEYSARFRLVSAKDMTAKPVKDMNKKEFKDLHTRALSANGEYGE